MWRQILTKTPDSAPRMRRPASSVLAGSTKDGGSDVGSPVRSYLEHDYRPTLDDQVCPAPGL